MYDSDERPEEQPDWWETSDTEPAAEPAFDYRIWPPEPGGPAARRDDHLRRVARLTWRAVQLSAVAAAAFVVLFVRGGSAQTTSSQSVVRPAGTVTPPAATPAPAPPHPRSGASAAPRPGHGAASPRPAAKVPATLAPPPAPPSVSPSPEPEHSTSSGSHSGG